MNTLDNFPLGKLLQSRSLTCCHTGRDSMWIENDIWYYASFRKGQIFDWVQPTHYAFLATATSKLVSNNGVSLKTCIMNLSLWWWIQWLFFKHSCIPISYSILFYYLYIHFYVHGVDQKHTISYFNHINSQLISAVLKWTKASILLKVPH